MLNSPDFSIEIKPINDDICQVTFVGPIGPPEATRGDKHINYNIFFKIKIEFETVSLKDPDENGMCREFVEASVSFKFRFLFNDER